MLHALHSRTQRVWSGVAAALFIVTLPLFGLNAAAQPAAEPAGAPTALTQAATEEPAAAAASDAPAAAAVADNASTGGATPQSPPDVADQPQPATSSSATSTSQPAPGITLTPTPTTSDTVQIGNSSAQSTAIRNNTDSSATSGNATLSGNDDVGDARSGEATVQATHVNVVNSTLESDSTKSGTGSPLLQNVYVRNIYNDAGANSVQGNILIDPASLVAMPADDATEDDATVMTGSVQSVSSLVDIENNVNLEAVSGNATVSDNDDAGDAVSGDATALANIINVVNSSVGAERSFVGVINIFGDLHGDIQVPRSFVDSLLAGTPPTSPTAGQVGGGPGPVSTQVNIENNVDLDAVSGDALITGNDTAGSARSGDATTHLNVYNLTGQEVVARNSLLVFINVMGRWVGMIMNAPGGESTSAALGGGVTSATAAGSPAGATDSTVNIRNNVSVAARSGDATVSGNDDAGDATSGNAQAGANILNLVHSSFNLDDWFGALFINVLGSWMGSFGILDDTSQPGGSGGNGNPTDTAAPGSGVPSGAVQAVRVFRFDQEARFNPTPQKPDSAGTVAGASDIAQQAVETANTSKAAILAETDDRLRSVPTAPQDEGWNRVAILTGVVTMSLLAVLTVIARRRYAESY